jgi:hypothetical protein
LQSCRGFGNGNHLKFFLPFSNLPLLDFAAFGSLAALELST